MGLLDEAIREHLELKLRNGADPQHVALQEQEALEPVQVDPVAEQHYDAEPGHFDDQASHADHESPAAQPFDADAAHVDGPQETVEFDMRSVIEPAQVPHEQLPGEQPSPGPEQLGLE